MVSLLRLKAVILIYVSLSDDCDDMTVLPPEIEVQRNKRLIANGSVFSQLASM